MDLKRGGEKMILMHIKAAIQIGFLVLYVEGL